MIRSVAVFAGLLFCTQAALGSPLPEPLELAHILGPRLAAGVAPRPLNDQLYVLGWSANNVIAVLKREQRATEQFISRLELIDLVEDETVLEKEWNSWEQGEDPQLWWAAHLTEIGPFLDDFKVEPTQQQLGMFPLILDNEYYTLALRTSGSSEPKGLISEIELVTHSTGRGTKTVADLHGRWRWATVAGFIPSPFQSRLALVLLVQPLGWAGELQPLRFIITGMSLKAGFSVP